MKKLHKVYFALLFALCFAGGQLYLGGVASALSGSDFVASRIIDDSTFFAGTSLNTGDIQNFLNAKVPVCDTNGTQPSGHNGYATRADWSRANGVPPPYTCLKDYSQGIPTTASNAYCGAITGGTKSAANLLFDVSQACGVSAQTLIVLLQKEQGLVTDDWPWPVQYRSATGFGCPDTAACDSTYYGFFNQIYNAAKQFKRYVAQPQNYNYAAGRTSFIRYNPNAACGGTDLTLQNQATAALYNYTPYQPNASALSNIYATGDSCGAYGNRNFWRTYNDWFGPTSGNGFTRVISSDSGDPRQWVLYGNIKQHIPDSQTLYAWGLQNSPLVTMAADYLATIPTGPNLERLMRLNVAGSNNIVYFVDGGVRHRVPWPSMMDAWNLNGMVVSGIPRDLFNLTASGADLAYSVKDPNSSDVYMLDGANGSGQTVLRKYQSAAVFNAWEGDDASYTTLDTSSGYFGAIDNAIGTTLTSAKISFNGTSYEAVSGSRFLLPNAATSSLYPGTAQSVSGATYLRLPDAGTATYLVRASSEPAVYLIDGGVKHHVTGGNLLRAWSGNRTVTIVNAALVSTFSTGADVAHYTADDSGQLYVMDDAKITVPAALDTAYRNSATALSVSSSLASLLPSSSTTATGFIIPAGAPPVYLLDNSGKLRHMFSSQLAGWAGSQPSITRLSSYIVDDMSQVTSPETYVTDGVQEYYLDNGQKWVLPPSIKTAWGVTASPQVYSDDTLVRLPLGGTLTDKIRDTAGAYYYIRGGIAYVTSDSLIGDVWGLTSGTQLSGRFAGSNFPLYMLTRFVSSSTPGDARTFVVDSGNWYSVTDQQFANLGGPGSPIMSLPVSYAPNSITAWTYVVVKSGGGTHYVVDGGRKRTFPNSTIQNYWTNDNGITVPSVTDGFLGLLPTRGFVERVVQGSGPALYAAPGSVKRHILYSSTYNQFYAPFGTVSDSLVNAMSTGADI